MYYSFSNSEKLYELVKSGLLDELTEEFAKADVVLAHRHVGICFSAEVLYKIICTEYIKSKQSVPEAVSKHAVELFTKAWDVDAIRMVKDGRGKYGKLDESAKKVLHDYEDYKNITISVHNSSSRREGLKKEIKETADNVPITIVYDEGRLSFFRNGREFVIYYGDDFF